MRKILLGTTAVVGAALFGTSVAQAQTAPTVRVGGYFEFTGGYVRDDADRALAGVGTVIPGVGVPGVNPGARPARTIARNRVDFRSDMEINVIVRGKAANGLSYGADIELQMDNVTNAGGAGNGGVIDTDEVWGFISSPALGTLQFGDQDSAADQLKVSAPSVTNLGESGGWDEFIAPSGDGTRYILSTINDGSDATKIIYLSPQFFGFDFGVSYAPNGFEGENFLVPTGLGLQRDQNQGTIRNEISGAIRYRGSFGNVGVAAAFSAMRGDAQANNGVIAPGGAVVGLQDPYAFQAGATLTAFGFSVGGHYVWGKYAGASFGRAAIRDGLDTSTNWTLGATYTAGPFQVGAFWAQATRDNGPTLAERRQRAWGIGAVYTLAPGLEVFGNYTNISNDNIANSAVNPTAFATQRDRDLDVFIIGTRLAF
jgi:predicted porin